LLKHPNLIPALDAIEAFGFWLKHAKPGWSISKPTIERSETGERYPIFALYRDTFWVGRYKTALDALGVIDDAVLIQEYLSIISDPDPGDSPSGHAD
jgi:hypothetical protein